MLLDTSELQSGWQRAIHAEIVCFVVVATVATAAALAGGVAAFGRNQEAVVPSGGPAAVDWPVYRGDPKGNQYSALAQIHAGNVHRLERAWEYKTGDANERSTMHVNPIVVNGVMYVTTTSLKAVALNAATGREIWSFDPARHNNGNVVRLRNRGLVYWKGAEGERIFHFVRDRAYAVDARTGELISSFGSESSSGNHTGQNERALFLLRMRFGAPDCQLPSW